MNKNLKLSFNLKSPKFFLPVIFTIFFVMRFYKTQITLSQL